MTLTVPPAAAWFATSSGDSAYVQDGGSTSPTAIAVTLFATLAEWLGVLPANGGSGVPDDSVRSSRSAWVPGSGTPSALPTTVGVHASFAEQSLTERSWGEVGSRAAAVPCAESDGPTSNVQTTSRESTVRTSRPIASPERSSTSPKRASELSIVEVYGNCSVSVLP